ncbi:MAG: DUF1801 domain-containing protein [Bacteroidota bacterium]
MAENKTIPTKVTVEEFLETVTHKTRRADADVLMEMMGRITQQKPRMWGPSIIGYGSYHYKYASGHEGDMAQLAFSPRKARLVLYILDEKGEEEELLAALGKYKRGKSCLYINKLADVDMEVLEQLVQKSWDNSGDYIES